MLCVSSCFYNKGHLHIGLQVGQSQKNSNFFFCFGFVVALKSSNSARPERNGIQESCRTNKPGEGIHILEGELLLQVCFTMDVMYSDKSNIHLLQLKSLMDEILLLF